MQEVLNRKIKELIDEYPLIADILESYNIGCVPCNVGSCLLKDIVDIHNLSESQERELLKKIARVIYPDREVEIPKIERKTKQISKGNFSPPVKKLVEEHKFIKRLIALIPEVIADLDVSSSSDLETLRKITDFIRGFADKYHHAKEEDILFKYFDESLDILKTMHTDHENARKFTRAILEGIEEKNKEKIVANLTSYKDLLTEHIKKEDEILYPWMDRQFSDKVVGELFEKFTGVDKDFGNKPDDYRRFVEELETRYQEIAKEV